MSQAYRGSGLPGQPVDRNPGAVERIPPDPRPERWALRVRGVIWELAWEVARRLPEAMAFALADLLGWAAYRLAGDARRRVRRNLGRVVAAGATGHSLDELVPAAFRSYARYWLESFRAADLDPADLDRRTSTDGMAHLDAALEGRRGVVVLLAHHGSWDVAARWAETHGYHLAVVTEVVRPRRVFEKFVRLREAVGLEVVPLRRGESLVGRLSQVLAANHLVGLLADRDLTGRGPVSRLFGHEARLPAGAVLLSHRAGAPIVPITMLQRPGRRWHLQVLPPVDVAHLTVEQGCAAVASAVERLVRLAPAQWHAFQPIWLADRPRRGRRPGPAQQQARQPGEPAEQEVPQPDEPAQQGTRHSGESERPDGEGRQPDPRSWA